MPKVLKQWKPDDKTVKILYPKQVMKNFSPHELRELRKAFNLMANKEGLISKRKLFYAMKRLGFVNDEVLIERMFYSADRNRDRRIDFNEFIEVTHCRFENMKKALETIENIPPRDKVERYQEKGTDVDPGGLIFLFEKRKKKTGWKRG